MSIGLAIGLVLFFVVFSRFVLGGRIPLLMDPASVAGIAWIGVLGINWWNPLQWMPPTDRAVTVLVLGVCTLQASSTFTLLVLMSKSRVEQSVMPSQAADSIRHSVYLRHAKVLTVVGVAWAFLYAAQLISTFGLTSNILQLVRATDSARGIGFYFFYPVQLAAILWWMDYLLTSRRRSLAIFVGLLLSLTMTSGRTNLLLTLGWAVFLSVFLRRESGGLRRVIAFVGAAVFGLVMFIALGDAVGKTYGNSAFLRYFGGEPPIPGTLALFVTYLAAPVAAFSVYYEQVVQSWNPFEFAIPFGEALGMVTSFSPPQAEGLFVDLGVTQFNLHTEFGTIFYAVPVWLGLIVVAVQGGVAGWSVWSWRRTGNLAWALAASLILWTVLGSIFDNMWNKNLVWLYLAYFVIGGNIGKRNGERNPPSELRKS